MPDGYLTEKQMNTPAAKELKARLEREKKRKYKAAPRKKKGKKAKEQSPKPAKHLSDASLPKGVLAKDASYAQNGHDYLKNDGKRNAVYKVDPQYAALALIAADECAAFEFPNPDYPENFNPGATLATALRPVLTNNQKRRMQIAAQAEKKETSGSKAPNPANQYYPYCWEAHHILPGSAFYYVDEQENHCFRPWQIQLILRSDYNINHGHNIIFLPDEDWAVPIHRMIQHPSDHPVYTQEVMASLQKVADELQALKADGLNHEGLKAEVLKKLRNIENKYWRFLVKLGKTVTDAPLSVKKPWVKYGTKKDPSSYVWGALY